MIIAASADNAPFQDLRRSGRSIQEDWPEFAAYARINGSHFSPLLSLPSVPSFPEDQARMIDSPPDFSSPSPVGSPVMRERRDTESHDLRTAFSPVLPEQQQRDRPSTTPSGRGKRSKAPTIIQRDRAIEKAALVEGAERIYLRYLLPGAEREIYLP